MLFWRIQKAATLLGRNQICGELLSATATQYGFRKFLFQLMETVGIDFAQRKIYF